MTKRIAVIDVGSNSIKSLVAESDGTEFGIRPLWEGTREVRISSGISGENPVLQDSGIRQGAIAVHSLCQECLEIDRHAEVHIVATSAVRSATNAEDFLSAVHSLTGLLPQVISGQEEADCIAMGIRSDPVIGNRHEKFTVFDLGGGSMEIIRFVDNFVSERASLPLGSVRLTEMFFSNPQEAIPDEEIQRMTEYLMDRISRANMTMQAPLVGCSGGLTTWRAIRASAAGVPIAQSDPVFTLEDVDALIREVVRKDVQHRINVARIPSTRADIFPAALITFKVLFDLLETTEILHSLHNLRYGAAWMFLQD